MSDEKTSEDISTPQRPFEIESKAEHAKFGLVTVKGYTPSGVHVIFDVPPDELDGAEEDIVCVDDLRALPPYSKEETAKAIADHLSLLFLPDDKICLTYIHSTRKTEAGNDLVENAFLTVRE